MTRTILTFLGISLLMPLFSQPLGPAYVVYFTDKNNSPYSIENPSGFLSEAAIDRRARQGIAVQMDDIPVNSAYLEVITSAGAQIAAVSRWFNKAGVWIHDQSIISILEAMPFISEVKAMSGGSGMSKKTDHTGIKPFSDFAPDEVHYESAPVKSILNDFYNYGKGHQQINMVSGISLHNQGYRGKGMIIAVLDAGFRNVDIVSAFDSLRANNRILGARDFVQPGNNVYNPGAHTHGTTVLSTMAANLPGQMVGTAPEASYWLLRTEDHDPPSFSEYLMEEYFWIAGAEFADSAGAWVINSSLGYSQFDDPTQNHTYADLDGNTTPITRAANKAASKGMVVVNSAGNSGGSSWQYIIAPADGFDVLAVGAVTADSTYVGWSSTGPSFDGRIKPDIAARGAGTWLVNPAGIVTQGSGTSFASPIIAGMAACLWQTNKNVSREGIYEAIIQSALQYLNPDNLLGYGIPNFEQAHLMLNAKSPIAGKTGLIKVYPNPADTFVKIETLREGDSIHTVTLSDIAGRIEFIRNYNHHPQHILLERVDGLRPGLYLLKVSLINGAETVKLVKL